MTLGSKASFQGATASQFDVDNDSQLLSYAALRDEDLEFAREAWGVFYLRHREYLARMCTRCFGSSLDQEQIQDLVHDTFLRAFEKAHTFTAGIYPEEDSHRKHVRAWLGTICRNLFLEHLEALPKLEIVDVELDLLPGPSLVSVETEREDGSELSPRVQSITNALATLTEREQDVIRVTMEHWNPGDNFSRLPNQVAAQLAAFYRTTSSNIRQIRKRAMDKINSYVANDENSRS